MHKILKFLTNLCVGYICNLFYVEYNEETDKTKLKFGFFSYLFLSLIILKMFNIINISYPFILFLVLSPLIVFLLTMFILSVFYMMYLYFKLI